MEIIIALGELILALVTLFLVCLVMGLGQLPHNNVEHCKEPNYPRPSRPGQEERNIKRVDRFSVAYASKEALLDLATIKDESGKFILYFLPIGDKLYPAIGNVIFKTTDTENIYLEEE